MTNLPKKQPSDIMLNHETPTETKRPSSTVRASYVGHVRTYSKLIAQEAFLLRLSAQTICGS